MWGCQKNILEETDLIWLQKEPHLICILMAPQSIFLTKYFFNRWPMLQDGGCGGSEVGAAEVDSLFWKRYLHHLSGGTLRIRSNPVWIRQRGEKHNIRSRNYPNIHLFSEPNGRIKGIVQNNHHISMVPAQLCYPLLEQEGLTGGQDNVLPPPRLLPRVWRWVSRRLSKAKKGKLLKVSTGRVQSGYVQYFNKSLEQILTNVVNGSFLCDIWITFNSVKLVCRNISRPRHLPPVDCLSSK